jgi:hypothetical protein
MDEEYQTDAFGCFQTPSRETGSCYFQAKR